MEGSEKTSLLFPVAQVHEEFTVPLSQWFGIVFIFVIDCRNVLESIYLK
jgi:hypothetical protein